MLFFLGSILLPAIAGLVDSAAAQILHEVFLPNTEHELNVYRVLGEEPGKTIMIIGGIQGDEPGGYMTADLYADIHLKKGNLIVVPRANFYSILLNRRDGLTGDMNRKFGTEGGDKKTNLEEEVVTVLKHLIAESDCLLNLHEGSGFYSPEWISNIENQARFGQSIIYDTRTYNIPGSNRTIELEELARKITDKVNPLISTTRYRFKLNNHDTLADNTPHREQRKSATFYALTQAHIPAFGVETSKSIKSLETKIKLHKKVINAFMSEFGVIIDEPRIKTEKPRMNYLLVRVNNGYPFALPHGAELKLKPGDDVVITDVIANYQRGLVADIEGLGTRNDTNIPFRISKSTRVIARKDSQPCGWIDLALEPVVGDDKATATQGDLRAEQLVINVQDEIKTVAEGQTLAVAKGTRLILQGIRTNIAALDPEVSINFKGFAPPKNINDGNDLYFPIYTDKDLWARYSENKKGKRYPIVATYNDKQVGRFWVELTE